MLRSAGKRGCARVARALPTVVHAPGAAAVRRRPLSALARGHSNVGQGLGRPAKRQQQQPLLGALSLRRATALSRYPIALPAEIATAARGFSSGPHATAAQSLKDRNRKVAIYMASVVTAVLGISYAAVPLYKVFCQVTGFGGTTQIADADKALKMKPVEGGRVIRVTFDGGTADTMPWKFRPTQSDVRVVPGETALAFFTAKNPTLKHITGVATYNVFPLKAGIYFNKIQCFCFEEQRLRAGEEIDMPVFFFLDPEMLDDPTMDNVNNVTLSYTFFQTAEEEAVVEEEEEDEEKEEEAIPAVVR